MKYCVRFDKLLPQIDSGPQSEQFRDNEDDSRAFPFILCSADRDSTNSDIEWGCIYILL